MKKILSIILASTVVISLFSITAYATKGGNGKGSSNNPAKSKTVTSQSQPTSVNNGNGKGSGNTVHVIAKGEILKFDVPPVIKNGSTLIPVRTITNALGAQIQWDKETGTVTITKGDTTIVITLGSSTATVNGTQVQISAPAELISNHTMVPIRFIAEALNQKVDWDKDTGSVTIGDGTDTSTDTSGVQDGTAGGTSSGTATDTGTADQTATGTSTNGTTDTTSPTP
ncbi:MAG: copper amine oxidase N-terminal domain-containing protein [Bacillota bacterium]|nr:copper amine oxidase N-terminal domain-containing protein [Bacillota bacterium]